MPSSSPPVSPQSPKATEGAHAEDEPCAVEDQQDGHPEEQGEGHMEDDLHTAEEEKSSDASKPITHRDDNLPSRLLWVGNISVDTTESILVEAFREFGKVDNMSVYPQRSYAFIEFNSLESAKAAKEGMQGKAIKGQALRIEFARPAKPSKHLWIWGVSESVTKEELEAEFQKVGVLEDFKLLRDRSSALAVYKNVEDATAAKEGLNKRCLGGSELRVDFLRSQTVKRWSAGVDTSLDKGKRNGPTETLKISYPPDVRADESALRRAFILFGEVEHIRTFPDRNYCFVQFRNADEATRAKEGLQGRLFNDSRVHIQFSNNDHNSRGEWQSSSLLHQPELGLRPSFSPLSMYGPNRTRMNMSPPGRPFVYQQGNRPLLVCGRQGGPQTSGFGSGPFFIGATLGRAAAESNMGVNGRLIPAPMNYGSTSIVRPVMDSHVARDRETFQREHKRAKLGSSGVVESPPVLDAYLPPGFPSGKLGNGQSQASYIKAHPQPSIQSGAGLLGPGNMEHHTKVNSRHASEGAIKNWKWQGNIAKAGTPICRVLCIPIGKGIDSALPDTVDCIARTSLDVLAQHFHQAFDFGLICFVPTGDAESACFKEFVHYLGHKNRAGVAKLEDGATLFLVPPSEFAERVLKVPTADRLLGLVIHAPHLGNVPSAYTQQDQSQQQQQQLPSPQERRHDTLEMRTAKVPIHSGAFPSNGRLARIAQTSTHEVPEAKSQAGALQGSDGGQAASPFSSQQPPLDLQSQKSGLPPRNIGAKSTDLDHPLNQGASEGGVNDRFQATLQLAAALLQRMHNIGASGPTEPQ